MSDNDDLATSKLKGKEPYIDPECGSSKLFKNKFGSRRSNYKLLVIVIFAVLGVSVVGLLWYTSLKAVNQDTKTCTTENCLRSATSFVESMNKSEDPCEDFYQFACGRYGNLHRIPKTSKSNDRFSEVHTKMLTYIIDFMEKEDSDNDPYALSQTRLLYRSCMATDEMDTAGIKQTLQVLDQIGLPHLGFTPEQYSYGRNYSRLLISSILANVKKHLNKNCLFSTGIEPDGKNRTINKMTLRKPDGSELISANTPLKKTSGMGSREIRETLAPGGKKTETKNEDNEEIPNLKSFEKYFRGVWMEIFKYQSNASNSYAPPELESVAQEVLVFKNELKKINDRLYDTDTESQIYMTVNDLQELTNKVTRINTETNEEIIDWKQYFTSMFVDMEEIALDFQNESIQINNIEYFEALFVLLANTTERQLVTYIWWDVVTSLLPYTTNQMRFIQDRYFYEHNGLENNPSRSTYCANAVNIMMGMAVSRVLIDVDLIDSYQTMVFEMMANIHWSFKKIVDELNWMDDATKILTLKKAEQMRTFVGFPEFIKDHIDLDNYYADFEVIENDFFGNIIRYVQRAFNGTLFAFREENDYTVNAWSSTPLEVNAFNFIQANAITIPAGILQFPFFGHDLQVLNYGSLGSILGHELTHGFDNSGHKYDADGNEHMWWTNKTVEEYKKRTVCFIDHYETYFMPGIGKKVSGKLTLDENIADNGGIREALWAYRKFVAEHGEERKLPGLEEFTNEQLYYLAFANNWCESSTYASLSESLLDEHSPNYVRVIAMLTNSEEFSEVWKCAKGTKMNPTKEKCKIW